MTNFPIVHDVMGKFMELPQDHVHAYIVELENSLVIVDATIAISSAVNLRAKAESLGKPIEVVLLTHGHPDHYSGLFKFEDLPRLASQGCLDFVQREDVAKAAVAKQLLGDDYPEQRVFPNQIIKDRDSFTFDGVKFTFTDFGPGESDSDGMWVFEKDHVKHAFVGDVVANRCHCFMRDGHLLEWLKLLDRLDQEFDESTQFYVGHGKTPSTEEVIAWQRGYIKTFIEAVAYLEDKIEPVSRATQEKIISIMQKYLPGNATLFLLDYELEISIPALWRKLQQEEQSKHIISRTTAI